MKKIFPFFYLLVATLAFSQSTADFNPPYPRVAMQFFDTPAHSYSNGTKILTLKGYDMVIIFGSVDSQGDRLATMLRGWWPNQIILGMASNGTNIWSPGPFFLASSFRAELLDDVVPGQNFVKLNTVVGLPTSNIFIKINEDVVEVNYVANDSVLVVRTDSEYAINDAHSAGDTVYRVYRVLGQGFRPYFSEYCPVYEGRQVWDFLADKNFVQEMPWDRRLWDGIFHDYFRVNLNVMDSDFDFDLNGVDDRIEHGQTWMENQWRYGLDEFVTAEKDLMEQQAPGWPNIFAVNTGSSMNTYYDVCNGHMFEGYQRFTTWSYIHLDAVRWMEQGLKPSVMFMHDYIKEDHFWNGKNRFNQVRFGLTHSMVTECYYGMAAGDAYFYWFWYDEFETDMGYPTGPISTLNGEDYLLVRYFDKGVAICNGTGTNQVVTAGQLQGGPYYRMKGGQDPDFNNGELFTEVELYGYDYGNHNLRGDGILLFTEPTTSVSDLIVDNFFMNATSPGCDAVELVGNWIKHSAAGYADFTQNNPFWAQSGSKWKTSIPNYDIDGANGIFDENYGYHASLAGNGENTATYIPTIGVPGWYEISEWHGWHGDTPGMVDEATNVPFEITVSGDVKIRGIINQQMNAGQWNRLGYANMPRGKEGYVRFTNKANGVVIADAVKFHYMGDGYVPDTTPPESPKNVRVY